MRWCACRGGSAKLEEAKSGVCVCHYARSLVVPGGSEKCVNVAFLTMYFVNYKLKA
jgi:ferredoxin-thioredoxin reductase catalytic subunit